MEPVTPLDWERLFMGVQPLAFFLEIALRVVLIYTFAVVVVRFMGKRGQRQMSSFEYVVIIALGSATGDSMFYPEVPVLYAWLIIVLIVALDRGLTFLELSYKWVMRFLTGSPSILVRNGEVLDDNLRAELLRREELMALLREQQVSDIGEVKYAILETTGHLGLLKRTDAESAQVESTIPSEA
jgi:uncharacterized membrane protein YcaP (DUF421 family)